MGRKWLWFSLSAVAVIAFLCVWLGHDKSPTYHGRTLSAWIQRLPAKNTNRGIGWALLKKSSETAEQLEAEDAVRHIGTNAIPYLLAEMHAKDDTREQFSRFWKQVKTFSQKLMSRGRGVPSGPPWSFDYERSSGELRHWNAAQGFHALGPLGKSAIPELMGFLDKSSLNTCPDAAYALSAMGPEGLAKMQPVLTNKTKLVFNWPQLCVIWSLGQTPDAGRHCVPELIGLLQDTNATVRLGAVWALGQLKSDEDLIAPALATCLGDPGANIKSFAEQTLGHYGITSVTRDSLQEYLNHPKLSVRMAATNAMIALYPNDAVKMGFK